jgi:hypothetical protein
MDDFYVATRSIFSVPFSSGKSHQPGSSQYSGCTVSFAVIIYANVLKNWRALGGSRSAACPLTCTYNIRNSDFGQTPIFSAIIYGKTEVFKFLLSEGADLTITEGQNYTPLHGAGFQGRAEFVPLLVAAGLDPSERHKDGFTPIHRACWGKEQRHAETIKAFIDAGVPYDQPAHVRPFVFLVLILMLSPRFGLSLCTTST